MPLMNGIGQAEQQRLNRALVIELLRRKKICSRADLSKASGLKRATITNIISDFIDCGLVVEDGLLEGDRGRRSIGIRVNGYRYRVIGVLVTRKHYQIGMMGLSGEMYEDKTWPIDEKADALTIIESIKRNIRLMIDSAKDSRILGIGIALPGPYKREKGEMIFVTNLIGWEYIPVHSKLQEDFDIPVFIENDANAGAYAQYWCCNKEDASRDLVYIVAGQGIGCGIISNGDILRGSTGSAGEIGHTSINCGGAKCECGNYGCLELYCSLIALEKNIKARMQESDLNEIKETFSLDDLGAAIRNGDPIAREEFIKACEYFAVGIVNMINQINPEKVIIGDQLVSLDPATMIEIVRAKVKETVRPLIWESLKIELNDLENNPILVGAGAVAAQRVYEDPLRYIK